MTKAALNISTLLLGSVLLVSCNKEDDLPNCALKYQKGDIATMIVDDSKVMILSQNWQHCRYRVRLSQESHKHHGWTAITVNAFELK